MEVELLEFLAHKPVSVNDVFRLGKYTASSKRPRPVLLSLLQLGTAESSYFVSVVSEI